MEKALREGGGEESADERTCTERPDLQEQFCGQVTVEWRDRAA